MSNKSPKLSNLKPFEKGKSGNYKGRPEGSLNMRTRLKRLLEIESKIKNPLNGKEENLTIGERIALAQVKKAVEGDTRAFDTLMRTVYGTYSENEHNVREISIEIVRAGKKSKNENQDKD